MKSIINLEDMTVKQGRTGTIHFTVTDENNNNMNGKTVIKFNQKTFLTGKVVDGLFSKECDFSDFRNDSYEMTVIFAGNDTCNASKADAILYIDKSTSRYGNNGKLNSKIIINDLNVRPDRLENMAFKVKDMDNNPISGKVTVKLNDKTFIMGHVVNGLFSEKIDFSNLRNKAYNMTVLFAGNKKCNPSSTSVKLFVKQDKKFLRANKMDSKIDLKDFTVKKGAKKRVEFTVTDENGEPVSGKVVMKINKKTFLRGKAVDGVFSEEADFSNLNNDSYDVTVLFGGNMDCDPASVDVKLYIDKTKDIELSIHDIQNASYRLCKWIEINKRLPGKIAINKEKITIGSLLSVLTNTIKNIGDNNTGIVVSGRAKTPKVSSESITEVELIPFDDYMDIVEKVSSYIAENREAPSTIESNYGNIGFMNLVYTSAKIVANSSSTGLLSSVYVRPWKKIVAK